LLPGLAGKLVSSGNSEAAPVAAISQIDLRQFVLPKLKLHWKGVLANEPFRSPPDVAPYGQVEVELVNYTMDVKPEQAIGRFLLPEPLWTIDRFHDSFLYLG
jgi:hypothetical protein